jgi:hypothetical protein
MTRSCVAQEITQVSELVITAVALVGFIAFIVAIARLGRGEGFDVYGLFGRPGAIERAVGVQEQDLPPFRFGASAA